MNKPRTILATLLLTTLPAAAAPVEVQGGEPGPSIRVLVDRTEREKALGLDRQLAGKPIRTPREKRTRKTAKIPRKSRRSARPTRNACDRC